MFTVNSDNRMDLTDLENNRQTKKLFLSRPVQWVVFLIGILSSVLIVLIFVPSAKITLFPKVEEQTLRMNFRSDPSIKEINLTGAIPFSLVEIEIEEQIEGESSGIIRIPDKKASGVVTFRNLTDQELLIPIGSIVRTNDDPFIRFETTKEVILEPGIESQIDVPVKCTIGGTNGNVPNGSITSIENELGGNIAVINQYATSGGVDIKTLAPTENDFDELKKDLLNLIITKSLAEFQEKYPQAFLISEETIKIKEIISEERVPEIGAPAERHILRITAIVSGWMIELEEIEKSVKLAMDSDLSAQYLSNEAEIEIEVITDSVKFKGNELFWAVQSSRNITTIIDEDQLIRDILGKENEIAKSLIMNDVNLIREPHIEISPSFWKYLPFLSFRINMVIDGN